MLVCSDLSLSSASAQSGGGGGNKKVYTRAAHCFDWKRGSDGCLLGLFLFCFDVRPRSDLNPIKGLFVPPGTAEGNI